MQNRLFALVFVTCALLCTASQARQPQAANSGGTAATSASAPALTEQKFRTGMMIDDVKRVVYKDEHGAVLSFEGFVAALGAGRSFSKVVEGDKSVAVMTVNPAEPKVRVEKRQAWPLTIPVASKLPALKGRDIAGASHRLDDRTHYTLLSFFFAECVPCIQEIPQLNALQAQGGKLRLLSITFDDKATARQFVAKRGLQLPVLADAQGYIDALGIKTYPTLVLVSPEGRLVGARTSTAPAEDPGAGLQDLKDWLASLGMEE